LHGKCSPTQFVTNCSMRKPLGERRHKQLLPSFMTYPWLEEEIRKFRCIDHENDLNYTIIVPFQHERKTVCSICYFGSLIRFAHFIIMVVGAPSLASPDGTSLIFYYSEFWATCACPENRVCPKNLHCIEIFFIFQDFWATCACPEKQSAWIHCIEYIFFVIQNFEQLALALKNRVCPEIFYSIEYTFYNQDFW